MVVKCFKGGEEPAYLQLNGIINTAPYQKSIFVTITTVKNIDRKTLKFITWIGITLGANWFRFEFNRLNVSGVKAHSRL